jgi:hypothetical protein
MGYQNQSRPVGKKALLQDISFDLSDLKEDIRNSTLNNAELIAAVNFIKESLNLATNNK